MPTRRCTSRGAAGGCRSARRCRRGTSRTASLAPTTSSTAAGCRARLATGLRRRHVSGARLEPYMRPALRK
eukprot:5262741-Prymnesium_polylepis.2